MQGNGQRYYVHARTTGTMLPWNFYQAPFEAMPGWSVVRIPFDAFEAQGRMLRKQLRPGSVTSLAIAAYGRDHTADVQVARIGLY